MAADPAIQRFGVIMAGGTGERFWPLSRRDRPKQLLALTHPDKSMLALAVQYLAPVVPPERIYVATGRHLAAPIRAAAVGVPDESILAEPCKRNTSGAIAYATACLMAAHPDLGPEALSLAITTADHYIGDPGLFATTIEAALTAAETQDALVVCGIVPTRPDTGFGYIQVAEDAPSAGGPGASPAVVPVDAFHEKPDVERATALVASGRCFWNSGMFFWKVSTFLDELSTACPELAQATHDLAHALRDGDESRAERVFQALEGLAIDYALMERARRVLMIRGDFPWQDMGSWVALQEARRADGEGRETDAQGNLLVGSPVIHEVSNSVIYNAAGDDRVAVGVAGVEGLAVVVTDDAVLVVPKDRAQEVRHLVEALKERGARQL